MRVTAILPTLDEERCIERALHSLADAGIDEVIVVDAGSSDATVELARERGAIVLSSEPGRSLQLNRGALAATGDVLWFVHADVRVPTTAVAAMARAFSDPVVVAGAFRTRTVNDGPPRVLDRVLRIADVRSHYTWHPYGDQALFVRRATFEQIGGYPPQPLLEDLELSRRLWTVGRIARCSEPVQVSGRRFLSRPVFYSAVMNAFPVLYRAGVEPDRLARWYGRVR